jgi:tetratricopeptide (TPR) repeat protein
VAIKEEEEPTAAYYLARGRTYACLSILTEAMKDLSIALNLDETLQEAYIYRGKCAYLLGDNNLAFLDFQRLILTDPKNPMVHVYAGNLLMTTGAYQDAIKAFLNADTVSKTAVAAFQRARCYCALTDLENAKMQFKIAMQLCKTEEFIQIDSQVLSSLMRVMNASSSAQGE